MGYAQEGMTDYNEEFNWDDVGTPIPVGEYDVELVEATYKLTQTNKHAVSAKFKIEAACNPDNESAVDRTVFETFVFSANAAFRVKRFAKAAGVELPMPINKMVLEDWCKEVLGTKVGVAIGHQDYQGEPQARITKFAEYGAGSQVEEEEEDEDDDNDDEDESEEQEEAQAAAEEPPKRSLKDAMAESNGKKNGSTKKSKK